MEEAGKVRRGYFVAGLGAAQFALPGAVDRLRALREARAERAAVVVLAAADPAQPYGAALPWPDGAGRPSRAAGAYVVLVDGAPAAFLERGARSLVTFDVDAVAWADALASLVKDGRLRKIELAPHRRRTGRATRPTPRRLRDAGFADGYRGLTAPGLRTRMPEGDTIHRTAATLASRAGGTTLTRFEAPRARRAAAPAARASAIESVEARGKHLLIGFAGGCTLHTHMR